MGTSFISINCRLPITFAHNLDPDQNVSPDLDSNPLSKNKVFINGPEWPSDSRVWLNFFFDPHKHAIMILLWDIDKVLGTGYVLFITLH